MKQRKEGSTALVKNDTKTNPNAAQPGSQQPTMAALQAKNTARTLLAEGRVLEKQGQLAEAAGKANERSAGAGSPEGQRRLRPGEDTPDQALQRSTWRAGIGSPACCASPRKVCCAAGSHPLRESDRSADAGAATDTGLPPGRGARRSED